MFQFFIAALIIAAAPGPDNLFVLAQSATYGAKSGFAIISGLCTGSLVQILLLVAGVSAVISASPSAFFVLQCLGAAYLLYLAYKSFRTRVGSVIEKGNSEQPKTEKGNETVSLKQLYTRGVIMNLTNPKVILFLLSFIPPAVDLSRPMHPSLQMFLLGMEFILATFIVFGAVAILAGAVKKYLLNSPKANRNLNWFSGVVFICLAVALFAV